MDKIRVIIILLMLLGIADSLFPKSEEGITLKETIEQKSLNSITKYLDCDEPGRAAVMLLKEVINIESEAERRAIIEWTNDVLMRSKVFDEETLYFVDSDYIAALVEIFVNDPIGLNKELVADIMVVYVEES